MSSTLSTLAPPRSISRGLVALALASCLVGPAQAAGPRSEAADPGDGHLFFEGELGFVDPTPDGFDGSEATDLALELSARSLASDFAADHLQATGSEELVATRAWVDALGTSHVRLQQRMYGLPVVGAELIVHADAASGEVYALNGTFAPARGVPLPSRASAPPVVGRRAPAANGLQGETVGNPELAYFHVARTGTTHLVWKVRLHGVDERGFFDDIAFVDAIDGSIVAKDAVFKTANIRQTFDAPGAFVTNFGTIAGLPGTLLCTGNQACGNASAQRAHDGADWVYDYYDTRFGRDGIDDACAPMISSVRIADNLINAAWYDGQMVYGDGDAFFFDLTLGFDVVAHEFTHGVTENEANLIYERESGALNEAYSDIFAAAAEAFRDGAITADTWRIGEDVVRAGAALRFMNDPVADGTSVDFYPNRLFPGSCTPSGANDNCGVHSNSGIGNLAFHLLVVGGTHPRGRTTNVVPGIGMAQAEQIFYRAQTTYLTSTSGYHAARTATVRAARDLYGTTTARAVREAWCAVGLCPPALIVNVTGPSSRNPHQSGTWTCWVSGGVPPYTRSWFRSSSSGIADLGSSTSVSTSHGSSFNVVCDVLDQAGIFATDYQNVSVGGGGGDLPF